MLLTVISFITALGVLIAIHEYGHYRVAVACGVKVLRFSVGLGRPIWRYQRPGSATEFVLGAFPLGGYVRMLDEREAPVEPHERHRAFNRQPLRARAAIVAAGPLANLALAVALYGLVNWIGVQEPKALLASPTTGSVAAGAGLRGGELVHQVALGDGDWEPVRSFEGLRWELTRAALERQPVRLEVEPAPGAPRREVLLDLSDFDVREADAQLFRRIGITGPWTEPVMGEIAPGGAAERAGLRAGDVVRKVGAVAIEDGQQLREWIRRSGESQVPKSEAWEIERHGQRMVLQVQPDRVEEGGRTMGRIGAYVGAVPEMVTVDYGPFESLWRGVARTWEVSVLTLRMMVRMVIGEASLKNLSGPLTIADYAGRSAALGWTQYLMFLALISVSLGVLNLLPLPVLDGGHLMYYLWEGVTGKGISDVWMERLQRGGVAMLLLMMSIALFNDITRLLG
ncbi:MAG: RIP metalloprotease RseP [Burkholderiaceae bacterium]